MSDLINLFRTLAEIPSPSMREDAVAEKIMSFFTENGIDCRRDETGNVYARVPATDSAKKPVMLSAHMDVVGDDRPVHIVEKDGFIETDKTRTLGADDKAGVSCAMMLAKETAADKTLKHGGLEIVFTRDEEQNMTGARNINYKTLESEHILVLDGDRLGELQIAGAGYTKMTLSVSGTKGGHSGIDIADTSRVNAVKLLAEIMAQIPQGVYKQDETGVVTSINAGAIAAGGLKNIQTDKQGAAFMAELADKAMTNMINTDAFAVYSIRSSDLKNEEQLHRDIESIVAKFKDKADVSVVFKRNLPPFERSADETVTIAARKAAETANVPLTVSSFHAAAETHLYATETNKSGVVFKPVLLGIANIYNMHSADEKIERESLVKGYALLKEIFKQINA